MSTSLETLLQCFIPSTVAQITSILPEKISKTGEGTAPPPSPIHLWTMLSDNVPVCAYFKGKLNRTANKYKCIKEWLTSVRMESTITNVPDLPMPALKYKKKKLSLRIRISLFPQ